MTIVPFLMAIVNTSILILVFIYASNYGNLQKLPKYIIINMRGGKWKI